MTLVGTVTMLPLAVGREVHRCEQSTARGWGGGQDGHSLSGSPWSEVPKPQRESGGRVALNTVRDALSSR